MTTIMDSLVSLCPIGLGLGLIVCNRDRLSHLALRTACKTIDLYVELKWKLSDILGSPDVPVALPKSEIKWITKKDNYGIYEIDSERYISFNVSVEPKKHHESGEIENIKAIGIDGKIVTLSREVKDIIKQCAGHGCIFDHGVPTLEQLQSLEDVDVSELKRIKKIIINTCAYDEYILGDDTSP